MSAGVSTPTLADSLTAATAAVVGTGEALQDLLQSVALRESALVAGAGFAPNPDDPSEVAVACARGLWIGGLGNAPQALTGTIGAGGPNGQYVKALPAWTRLRCYASVTNTGPNPVVTITGVGSPAGTLVGPLLRRDGTPLVAGDVPVGILFDIQPDGQGSFRVAPEVASDKAVSIGQQLPAAVAALNIVGANRRYWGVAGTYSWPVPTGVYRLFIRVWGAGGGGSGGINAAGAAGGADADVFNVTPGQVLTFTVGAGGTGTVGVTSGSGNYGGTGGTTSVGNLISATGGQGGQAGLSTGGVGSGGKFNMQGAPGQDLDSTNCYALGGGAPLGGGCPSPTVAQAPGGGGGASGPNSVNNTIASFGWNGAPGAVEFQW